MRNPPPLRDGIFLEMELNRQVADNCHINLVYLESPKKRVVVLTEKYASKEAMYDTFVKDFSTLCARARELCPSIGVREADNLAMLKDLPFEPQDIRCDYCGSRPGERCNPKSDHVEKCAQDRECGLKHFLIWLAEQCRLQTKMTKKLIIDVAEALGYNSAENLYYKGPGVVVTTWSGDCRRLYVGGPLDPTRSVWMTRGPDMTKPEHGPFQTPKEIALVLHAMGRGQEIPAKTGLDKKRAGTRGKRS